ncbi:MAG: isopentenyl-diphosphate delta-isomerase, partial [Ileibacterium sp.]|nr:isopentenyl-diphosphate delta-isomerase [Ileibacterium sp.]
MYSKEDLRQILRRIDRRSYPAYKDTRGSYNFGNYILSIVHVQSDPFASPSDVSVEVPHAGFP